MCDCFSKKELQAKEQGFDLDLHKGYIDFESGSLVDTMYCRANGDFTSIQIKHCPFCGEKIGG